MVIEKDGEWTFEKREAFRQLKTSIINEYGSEEVEDSQIYRFLIARDFNLKQSHRMLKNHMEWRKKFKVNTILEDYQMPEIVKKYVYGNIIGFDKEGCPVMFFYFGNLDWKGIFKSTTKTENLSFVIYFLQLAEKLLQKQSTELGKPLSTWSVIVDYENLSLKTVMNKLVIERLLEVLVLYEANYPERLKSFYAYNVNPLFYILFNMVKTFLSTKTLNKVKIFTTNGWREEFLTQIDKSELPAFLGGTKTDLNDHALRTELVKHGGQVPDHYYLKNNEKKLFGQPGVKQYFLDRKAKIDIVINVHQQNSSIEWEFEVENNDIAFGLFYTEKKGKCSILKPVIDTQRVDAHLQVEAGIYKVEKEGEYILILDNSYSWLRQKLIYCRVTLITPNGQKTIVTI